jgi:uncharacterized protein (DUF2141 family)
MRQHLQIPIFAFLLLLLACARQTTPTGGPKDTIPPRLISSLPKHEATNFNEKNIELTFDEDIILNNPKEQLIITPALSKEPLVKTKKEKVIITFEEDLAPNATYSINFRESIQDITEKNPTERLRLAFSTGSYIDSLSIEGKAHNHLTSAELKDVTIALYQSDTFDIFKHRPTYIAKSDAKGDFKLDNLKPGTYFLYAIEDKSKNLIVDSKTESYGYLLTAINLVRDTSQVNVPLVRLDSRPLKLTSARPYGTYFNIKTTKNISTFKITSPENEPIISSFGEDHTNVKIYNTLEEQDSIAITFQAADSILNTIDTTLFVKFSDRNVKPENFSAELQNFQVIGAKGILEGSIKFNKPLLTINYDSTFYKIDSLNIIRLTSVDMSFDSLQNILYIKKIFDNSLLKLEEQNKQNQNVKTATQSTGIKPQSPAYQLYLGSAAFVSIELDSSQQKTETISPLKLEDTGILFVDVQTKAPHFIVQLLTKDFKLITSKRDAKKTSFEDLKPGDYQVRLIIDNDNNGNWTPGNFSKKVAPEPISFYRNEKNTSIINLKANWELGPLLIKY